MGPWFRLSSLLCAGAFVASAASVAAQERGAGAARFEWCGFPGGGVVFTEHSANAPDFTNYAFGTSLTWNVSRWIGLEGEAGFGLGRRETVTFDGRTLSAQPMPDTIAYSGNVVVNGAGNDRAVVPYAAAGLGALRILGRTGTEMLGVSGGTTLVTGNAGGGLKWYSVRRWGVRADYRLMIIGLSDGAPRFFGREGTRYAHRVYAGVFATL